MFRICYIHTRGRSQPEEQLDKKRSVEIVWQNAGSPVCYAERLPEKDQTTRIGFVCGGKCAHVDDRNYQITYPPQTTAQHEGRYQTDS